LPAARSHPAIPGRTCRRRRKILESVPTNECGARSCTISPSTYAPPAHLNVTTSRPAGRSSRWE
jgi:hypothetical protein